MGNNEVALITDPDDWRKALRQHSQGLQKTQGFLIGAACTIEKALESSEMDDEARRLVNSASFQLQQIQEELQKLHTRIDSLPLPERRRP